MKYKLFSCLILVWIILTLTGKDFIGGPETVPQGWNFHKPDSKTYYFSGRKIVGKHAGKLGIVNDPKEGKIVKLLPSWDFYKKDIECQAPGLLEIILYGKSERANAVLKAKMIGREDSFTVGKDWQEIRIYRPVADSGNFQFLLQNGKGKTLFLKSWSIKMLPLDENRESEFLGNPGELPALWKKTSWSKDSDFTNCGITSDDKIPPYRQSLKLSGNDRMAIIRDWPNMMLGKEGSKMEFSIWMKGNAPNGVKIFLVDEKWKWVNQKTFIPNEKWQKYTLSATVSPEAAGKSFCAIIETTGSDVLIGKYYIGTARKEGSAK